MKIACLGGGPAGLYFAISMKLRDATHDVTVFERNRPDDTFGWGVVFSDETFDNIAVNDPVSAERIRAHFAYWDDIAVHYRDKRMVSSGHGFSGIARKKLLMLLQDRARELGVRLHFQTEIASAGELAGSYDLVVAADGLNSRTRGEFAEIFKPAIDTRRNKFVWLGTHQKFDDAFTFIFEETEHGWIWAHAYQFDADTATFIVECSEATWQKFGFGTMSQDESCRTCERIFANHLGGHRLMSNAAHIRGSAWLNFPRVLCETWSHRNIVLMGDAAATAHFSIGSGTKLAMESAVSMANYLHAEPTMPAAFAKYEDARRTEVLRLQSAARNSLEWFEDVERYLRLDPVQFNYSLLTRSQRISHENLRLRDKAWLEGAEAWFQRLAGARQYRAPADVRAVSAARHAAEEPRRRLADGAIQGGRRLPDRLASGALRRARQGRRRPRLHRDDLRQPGGSHHARLHRPICARARSGMAAHRRFRPCRNRRQNLLPARSFRRQRARPSLAGRRWMRRLHPATGR
jgi:anthraniloyl-CoA monooxygenase